MGKATSMRFCPGHPELDLKLELNTPEEPAVKCEFLNKVGCGVLNCPPPPPQVPEPGIQRPGKPEG